MVRVAILLRVVSSKRKIRQLEELERYCKETYCQFLWDFPMPVVVLSPSMHKLLGHTWELVEKNGGMLSEGGLEACNKLLRNYRSTKARNNLTDCQNRLFRKSDPVLERRRQELKPYCSICSTKGHNTRYCPSINKAVASEEDALVESFF